MICFYGKWKFVPNLLVVLTIYKPLFFQLSVEGFAVDKMAGEVKVRKVQFTFHFSIQKIKILINYNHRLLG